MKSQERRNNSCDEIKKNTHYFIFVIAKTTLLLAVAFLSLLPQTADAVSCFKCAADDKECNDPFNAKESKVSKCTGKYCLKSKATFNGVSGVGRDCAEEVSIEGCVSITVQDVPTTVCTCKTELCNGSAGLKSQSLLAFVMAAVAEIGATWAA
ncbi:hypothetical protein HELRODRAFT_172527 [Helobdella robusta]|uniref:Protein sleepless n=1 Tax=Helobdella robusta TaxID=6412 RepID=T1F5G7_HELRO|nr:hypothetical protein HELRODRAFT_172527 [Helobdella robusta]ESO04182.1 hypothetical protein HELRODRAFT_172527 [Helobdella robusta]